MPFLGIDQRIVPAAGDLNAKICIIGEAPGAEEDRLLKPFVGPAGSVLESCLHSAGLTRSECYITNVIKVRPHNNNIAPFYNDKTGRFTEAGQFWVNQLATELKDVKANILVPMGNPAMSALTGERLFKILKYRGYICEASDKFDKRKILPTIHPAATMRGQYILRYLISGDLKKALAESNTPEIIRPERTLIYKFTFNEVLEWLEALNRVPRLAFDIEVINYEVSCISLASSSKLAISIPLYNAWTEEQEVQVWRGIQTVLENPDIEKIVQNGIFDIHFLYARCGIEVRGRIHDLMIKHHLVYPDMKKSLAFLGSCYAGAQSYWKDMVKFDNIKRDS